MASTVPCPMCARAVAIAGEGRPAAFPFCSERCRLRDLEAWCEGRYTVPGGSVEEQAEQDGWNRDRP